MSNPPFQQLVDEYWLDVGRLAYALAGSNGEDVAQQAWMQALNAYPKVRADSENLRAWLLMITRRCAIDHHRQTQRLPTSRDEALESPTTTAPAADVGLPDSELWDALKLLPEREQMAVSLKYLGDLEHHDIADHLGISSAMSRRLVSDGMKKLRKLYLSAEGA